MISKKNRLNRSRVQYTLKKGRKLSDEHFVIKFIPSRYKENRFCVTVSLKVAPLAVKRNRLRRQIYEILRLTQIKTGTPLDIVIIAKPSASRLSYEKIQQNLIKILNKLNG